MFAGASAPEVKVTGGIFQRVTPQIIYEKDDKHGILEPIATLPITPMDPCVPLLNETDEGIQYNTIHLEYYLESVNPEVFPKFKFLKDTNKNKQKDQLHLFFQLKVFDSSTLLNNKKEKEKEKGSDIGKKSIHHL